MTAHQLTDITVVADAGMLSEANMTAIKAAGLGLILGNRIAHVPYALIEWREQHPGGRERRELGCRAGRVDADPAVAGGASSTRRGQVIYYQHRADRPRRALKGIDEQVGKAEKAVAGKVPVKRNQFITPGRRREDGEPGTGGQGPARWPGGRATSPTRAQSS